MASQTNSSDLKDQILWAIAELSELVIKNDSLDDLIEVVSQHLISLTGASSTFVHLVQGDGAYLELVAIAGRETAQIGQRLRKGEGAAGTAWETASPLYIADYEAFAQRVSSVSGVNQACALPMLIDQDVIGVLGVMFSTDDVRLANEIDNLQQYANLTSIALRNARLILQTTQELHLSHLISQLIEQIAGCKNSSHLMEVSASGIIQHFGANQVEVWRMNHDGIDQLIGAWHLCDSAVTAVTDQDIAEFETKLRDQFESNTAFSRSLSELRFLTMPYFEVPFVTSNEMAFVLLDQGESWGLLRIHQNDEHKMTASESNLLRSIVGHISMAARLHRMIDTATHRADHDHLTGLPNKHCFINNLELATMNADKRQELFALYFIDLDGFKEINDSLGHAEGDNLLVQTAERIGSVLPAQHVFSRFGGDEFALMIEVERPTDAAVLARELIRSLDEPFELSTPVSVSASIGCIVYAGEGYDAQALLVFADKAMYRAKHLGKSQYNFDPLPRTTDPEETPTLRLASK